MSLVGWSDEAALHRAYRALAVTPARLDVLRLLVFRGEVSTTEIMREVGLSRNGARMHLLALRSEGLVVKRHETHPRGAGPITYWRADTDELADVIDTLIRTLTP